jgi:hypothetical protein
LRVVFQPVVLGVVVAMGSSPLIPTSEFCTEWQ